MAKSRVPETSSPEIVAREPLFFKIGEAAERVGVTSQVIRFWTKEFPIIEPQRLRGRHRLYSKEDVRLFQEIKRLLYEERFTIEGARKRLARGPSLFDNLPTEETPKLDWPDLKRELIAMREILTDPTLDGSGGAQ
ncbi:MAG: MerR family transcriptional regulator [Deltaproteobacteria bacterium]|jgi:DNA-binding transcriptional MerR regulator|nr:MerR family transcriptional regulator [Deltaproteobacteria bacterium]